MKSKLLDENKLNELLSVKTIQEVIELLQDTPYQEELGELSTKYSGVELVNQAVTLNFAKTMKKLAKFIPAGESELLELVLEAWTIQNLKAIIASKATGTQLDFTSLAILNSEQEHCLEDVRDPALDLKKTVKKLAVRGYGFSEAFKKMDRKYNTSEKIEDFRVLFKELDEYYYSKLGKIAESEKDICVKALLRAKIDFQNTMIVARLKLAGASREEIEENIIKCKGRINRESIRLNQKETIEEMVEEIINTHGLNKDVSEHFKQTNSLVKLEVELERMLNEKALRLSKASPLSFSVMLSYIYLKQQEITAIKAIAYSTQAGVKEEIKNLVFAVKK